MMTTKKKPVGADGHGNERSKSNKWTTRDEWVPNTWDVAKEILKSRPLFGKLLKTYGESAVWKATLKTLDKAPADPKSFLIAACKGDSNGTVTPKKLAYEAKHNGVASQKLLEWAHREGIATRGKSSWELAEALENKLSEC